MAATPLVAVAHGTRDVQGPRVIEQLLDLVRYRMPGVAVHVAFVDVIEPTLDEVLTKIGGPAIVVPMFLAAGYHVRVDVPDAVVANGNRAEIAAPLGPAPEVIDAMAERFTDAGALPDGVVMAAAGSSDALALQDVRSAAGALSSRLERDVVTAYASTAEPAVSDAVAELRAAGRATVGIASYLIAPGLFQRKLHQAGADFVAEPLGVHERIADLVVARYQSCL